MKKGIRQIQKEKTKEKILESAYTVYCEKGFAATTSLVAETAGVSHGTIFVHFSTQHELLNAVIDQFGKKMGALLHELSEGKNTLIELLHAHLDLLEEHEPFYRRLVTEYPLLPEESKLIFLQMQAVAGYHFNKVLEEDEIKPIPFHMIFNMWIGLVHYYLQNKPLFAPMGSVIQKHRHELIESFSAMVYE